MGNEKNQKISHDIKTKVIKFLTNNGANKMQKYTKRKNQKVDVNHKTNFSCNLFTLLEFDKFNDLANRAGINKTAYFRLMLKRELKDQSIMKSIIA